MSAVSTRFLRCLMLLLSLLLLFCGCAGQQMRKSMIWESRQQFVAVTDREVAAGNAASANTQPVSLSRQSLRSELAALKVKFPDAKPLPLFAEPELKLLTEQLPTALQQAGPHEDVVFAVYGTAPFLMRFGTVEVVTTGRVFYQENRLNLILGMVREPIRESDRRLQPFIPGSRLKPAALPAVVTSPDAAFAAGRPDWLLLKVQEAKVGAAEEVDTAPVEAVEPEAREEAHPAAVKVAPASAKRIEERLMVLNGLKAKGLITEEEYRLKKESILKEL